MLSMYIVPGAHIGFLVNTFVHIVMYYYFMETAIVEYDIIKFPEHKDIIKLVSNSRLWYRIYITKLQVVQFIISFMCVISTLVSILL